MQFFSSLIFSVTLLSTFNLVLGAPIQSLSNIDARGIIGSACFGSSNTGCTVKHHKRADDVLFTRDAEPAPVPASAPVEEAESIQERGIVGSGCFGGTGTGCVVKHHKKAEELVTREAEPAPEPQGFTIGTPCFGSKKTGCTLKHGHKRAEDLVVRAAEAVPEPQGFTIGTSCFGSKKTGCTLKQGHKREKDSVSE